MENFLSQVGQVESEGAFTLDLAQALRKLPKFQLAEPGEYLLKAIQSASALGSEKVDVRLGLRTVRVDYVVPQDACDPTAVAGALSGQAPWGSTGARHLGVALQAAFGSGSYETVSWKLGNGSLSLGESGVECQPNTDEHATNGRLELRRKSLLKGISSKLFGGLHTIVHERAAFSEMEVRLDSRAVRNGWKDPKRQRGKWYSNITEPHFLMQGFAAPKESLPGFLFRSLNEVPDVQQPILNPQVRKKSLTFGGEFYEIDVWPTPERYLLREFAPDLFSSIEGVVMTGAVFALPLELSGPAEIRFLLDGVTSRSLSIPWDACPGLQCVASGNGLKVDLTEFQIVDNEALKRRLKALESEASRFMKVVRAHQESYLSVGYSAKGLSPIEFREQIIRRLQITE